MKLQKLLGAKRQEILAVAAQHGARNVVETALQQLPAPPLP